MSDFCATAIAIVVVLYLAGVVVAAANGLMDYSIERNSRRRPEVMRKSARHIKCAFIWPTLIPRIGAGHFLEDLRRDMRRNQ